MGRPLIICAEAPEGWDDAEPEKIADWVNNALGHHWTNLYVWDERDFESDVSDFGSVKEAVDASCETR